MLEPGEQLRTFSEEAEPPLARALDALTRGSRNPGGALHRRRINASIFSVAHDGTVTPLNSYLQASVTAALPSALGDGLLDVALDSPIDEPMPTGVRQIWELWRAGRPTEASQWARYDPGLRHHWAAIAMAHRRHGMADKPAGTTYHLDGLTLTTLDSFYCALGEAVNGPGGYFGMNSDALHDCLLGGFGATRPFRLVWHNSSVAQDHLTHSGEQGSGQPISAVDQIIHWLAEDGIEVELR